MLAHHFSRAENWEKAVHYGHEAARRATRLQRFPEALESLERIRKWHSKVPESEGRRSALVEILLDEEAVCQSLGMRTRQQSLIDELLSRLEPEGDPSILTDLYAREGELQSVLGNYSAAEKALEKSLSIARSIDVDDVKAERKALRSTGFLRWQQGKLEEAIACNEAAILIDESLGDAVGRAKDLLNICSLLRSAGQFDRALSRLDDAFETFGVSPELENLFLWTRGQIYRDMSRDDDAIRDFRRAFDMRKRLRTFLQEPFELAQLLWRQGRIDETLEVHEDAIRQNRKRRNLPSLSRFLHNLGGLLLGLGRLEEALPHLAEAAQLYSRLEDHEHHAQAESQLAQIYEDMKNYPDALAARERVHEIRTRLDDGQREIASIEDLARLVRLVDGNPSREHQHLETALEMARQIGDRKKESHLLNSLGILEWKRGHHEQALAHYEQALEILQELEDPKHTGLVLNSIAVTLSKLRRYDQALSKLEDAIRLNRENGQRVLEGHGLAARGDIFKETGKLADAFDAYQASLSIREEIGDRNGEGWMLHRLAQVCQAQSMTELAGDYASRAVAIAIEVNDLSLKESCDKSNSASV